MQLVFIAALDPCDSNPCLQGGLCATIETGYRCYCPDYATGVNCEIRESKVYIISMATRKNILAFMAVLEASALFGDH